MGNALSVFRAMPSACMCLSINLGSLSSPAKAEDQPQFRDEVIMQVALEHVEPGNYALRMRVLTMEPLGKIPPHVHEFGGVRYVLDGAITINWKDGRTQTFAQGSTYFEGPGQNHPAGAMAASNPVDKPTRVLIVELVPIN
jgi:quercetin dioxygenase-like cupin family protein